VTFQPESPEVTEVEAKKLAHAEQQALATEGVRSRSSSRKKRQGHLLRSAFRFIVLQNAPKLGSIQEYRLQRKCCRILQLPRPGG